MQTEAALIDHCAANESGQHGIMVSAGSLVLNSVARANRGYGFILGAGGDTSAGYRSNVASSNNGGDANVQILGGTNLGENLCGLSPCP